MKLNANDLQFLSQCAISAARKAGNIIQQYASKTHQVRLKQAADSLAAQIVTEVDILAQQVILDSLLASCQDYDLGLLTEESNDDHSRLQKDYFWCIDPLDGTLYFSQGESGYSVSIALVSKQGESLVGVVYDPYNDKLFTAVKGENQLINNQSIEANETKKNTISIICDRHYLKEKNYQVFLLALSKQLARKGYSSSEVISKGGAVKSAIAVLENSPACYFKLPKEKLGGGCLWDYAATSCFFFQEDNRQADGQKNKGVVSDISGNSLNLNSVESLYMNHCGIVYASAPFIAGAIYQLSKSIDKD